MGAVILAPWLLVQTIRESTISCRLLNVLRAFRGSTTARTGLARVVIQTTVQELQTIGGAIPVGFDSQVPCFGSRNQSSTNQWPMS